MKLCKPRGKTLHVNLQGGQWYFSFLGSKILISNYFLYGDKQSPSLSQLLKLQLGPGAIVELILKANGLY